MWGRFTERARRVVFFAQEEAGRRLFNLVDTEHLLLGMLREYDNVAMLVLKSTGINLEKLDRDVRENAPRGEKLEQLDMQLTSTSKSAINIAYDEAQRLNNNYIGTEHLLLGLLREETGLAARELASHGVELAALRVSVAAFQEAAAVEAARKAAFVAERDAAETSATLDRLTESARHAMSFAHEEAEHLGERHIWTEHLLLGVLRANSRRTTDMLRRLTVTSEEIKAELTRLTVRGSGSRPASDAALTPQVVRVIDIAQRTAASFGDTHVGSEHLFIGLIQEGNGLASRVLRALGVTPASAMNAFRAARSSVPSETRANLANLEIQLEELERVLGIEPTAPTRSTKRPDVELPSPSALFGDLGVSQPAAERTRIEVAHDAAAFRKLLAVFQAKDAYGYRSLIDGDQTVFLLPSDTRLKLLVPPPECDDLVDEGHHVRVLEGDYAGYAGWIVKAAFQRTSADDSVFPPADQEKR